MLLDHLISQIYIILLTKVHSQTSQMTYTQLMLFAKKAGYY